METVRITESEIMAALVDAAAGDAPDDARTAQEMAVAAGVSVRHVRDALKLLQGQGRLHVHRVMRLMPRAIARIKATKPEADLPPIPSAVYSMLGPVPIVMVPDLKHTDGVELLGKWCPEERCIKLRPNVTLLTQWVTLIHEWLHIAHWDAGTGLGEEAEERVCDSLSSFLFAAGVRL